MIIKKHKDLLNINEDLIVSMDNDLFKDKKYFSCIAVLSAI